MSDLENGKDSNTLKHRSRWLALGVVLVAIVIFLSVAKLSLPQVPSSIGDKLNHLIAYGVLMGWFGQLYSRWNHRLVIAVVLVLMGVAMEYVQGTMSHRVFEWLDAAANSLGVLLGFVALACGADRILHWFENRIVT